MKPLHVLEKEYLECLRCIEKHGVPTLKYGLHVGHLMHLGALSYSDLHGWTITEKGRHYKMSLEMREEPCLA